MARALVGAGLRSESHTVADTGHFRCLRIFLVGDCIYEGYRGGIDDYFFFRLFDFDKRVLDFQHVAPVIFCNDAVVVVVLPHFDCVGLSNFEHHIT